MRLVCSFAGRGPWDIPIALESAAIVPALAISELLCGGAGGIELRAVVLDM
jgi:hypothetical protein